MQVTGTYAVIVRMLPRYTGTDVKCLYHYVTWSYEKKIYNLGFILFIFDLFVSALSMTCLFFSVLLHLNC